MGLDTRFIPIFTLQEWFVDKNNGDPLEGGIVSFYNDNSRSTPKQVYELVSTGAPPSYTYQPIGTQLILSNVGTFVDGNGADIAPYLFPYDGDASTTTNTLELYYVTVQGSSGSPQFTREGVPNLSASSSAGSTPNLVNHIPNGQFQLHNDHCPVPGGTTFNYGGARGTVNLCSIAPGGIFFERSSASAATDTISFVTQGFYSGASESASPRFLARIRRSVNSIDAVCGLTVRFMDVYKFSNPDSNSSSQPQLTFLFNAALGTGTSLSGITVNLVQYFGVGGSATATTTLTGSSLTFTNAQQQFAVTFPYRPLDTTVTGANNDDFLEIEIAFPSNATWDIELTDLILVNGTYQGGLAAGSTLFPQLTNGQFLLEAVSNIAPTTQNPFNASYYPQDGSDLYLPMIKTKDGWTYDYSVIGRIEAYPATTSWLSSYPMIICNGTQISGEGYDAQGVPYSRLRTFLLANSPITNIPLYGTGLQFGTAYVPAGSATQIRLVVNVGGVNTAAAAGTSGFVMTPVYTANAGTGYKAYNNTAGIVLAVLPSSLTANAAVGAGTSGFTVTTPSIHTGYFADQAYSFTVATVAGAGLAGLYFTFSNAATDYYMWFTVNGVGADPAVGGRTGIPVNLKNTDTAQDVANIVRETLNNYQSTLISIGVVPTAAQYFTFQTNNSSASYYVWYFVNGLGSDPAPGGTGIKVSISSANTTAQVRTATQLAINSFIYGIPDLRGMFLRGFDPTGIWDTDYLTRVSNVSGIAGANLGTFEYQQFLSHAHGWKTNVTTNGAGTPIAIGDAGQPGNFTFVTSEGGTEIRPVNSAVNYYMRY